ncbi:MAG: hypothetical protein ACXVB2_25070 [Isosphaeraceae bacterium]
MTSGEVLVQLDDDVLRVTINRPEKRNPLSRAVLAAINSNTGSHGADFPVGEPQARQKNHQM